MANLKFPIANASFIKLKLDLIIILHINIDFSQINICTVYIFITVNDFTWKM